MKGFLKRLVPAPFLYKLARLYWFFCRPTTVGVKVVLRNGSDILCVRHTYQPHSWSFPGGHVGAKESPEDALRREVKEEVGVNLGKVVRAGEFNTKQDYKDDIVFVYYATTDEKTLAPDRYELAEARWFPVDNMPSLPPNAARIFALVQEYV